jgi:hypothetical protein
MTYNRQDKFGYYLVGTLKFYSKLEAIEFSVRTNQKVTWHFNDVEFGLHDWTVEPTETLEELYRQRAQQLREKYDYLVLWFSGGSDSDNILHTFVTNNIKLDECASLVNYAATGSREDWLNGEIYNVAVPKVNAAKHTQPWMQHTLIDIAQPTIDYFSKQDASDWVYGLNNFVNPNSAVKQEIKKTVPHWMQLVDQGKRVGFIYGLEKPMVHGFGKNYYFKFTDSIDNAVSNVIQSRNDEWDHNELFYWDPSCVKLLTKQGHAVKRFLKKAEGLSQDKERIFMNSTVVDKKVKWLTIELLNKIVYPGWTPVDYQVKPTSLIHSPRDRWFFKLPDNDAAKHAWKIGIEHLWNTLPQQHKLGTWDGNSNVKRLSSKFYDLGS